MEAVFYDGVDVKSKVTELAASAATAKTIMLEHEPGAVLAIACHDHNNGDQAGFFFHCEDEQKSSAGTFTIQTGKTPNPGANANLNPNPYPNPLPANTDTAGTRECKVFAGNKLEDGPSGWTKNGFDDTSWKAPERNKGIST